MKHFTLLVATLALTLGLVQQGFSANGGGNGGNGGGGETTDCGCKEEDNFIKNSSFESGLEHWSQKGHAEFITENKYPECGAMNGLIHGAGSLYQDVALTKIKSTVTVKVFGGTHQVQAVHKFVLIFLDEDGNEIKGSGAEANMDFFVGSENKLKEFTLYATAPDEAKGVRFAAVSEGDYFKVDAVCMTIETPPMPVTLASFNAAKEGNTASLNWTTTFETNSDYFDVQHSQDGKSWAVLTTIQSQGESKVLQSYSYTHTSPLSSNLYRLKMVDVDGTFAYSSIKSLNFSENVAVEIYPNPTVDRIRLTSAQPVSNVKVYSATGALVLNAKPNEANEVDLKSIAQGIYYVRVNDHQTSKKIVVVR